jgi:Holliday junction resolvase-like predicted endonuclease
MNFLEQLVAEWYQYEGYLVRSNVRYGRRRRGGWVGEIDVIAFRPETEEFIHIEASTDSDSWEKRKKVFNKKFSDAKEYYLETFSFKNRHIRPKKVVIVGLSKSREPNPLGEDIQYISIPDFIQMISVEMRRKNPKNDIMPESYPLMRAIQYSVNFIE